MLAVSVPYEITLLSNTDTSRRGLLAVSVPYEITLLSNYPDSSTYDVEFQYLMKLHYSQTLKVTYILYGLFQYLMKLHYSQTNIDTY